MYVLIDVVYLGQSDVGIKPLHVSLYISPTYKHGRPVMFHTVYHILASSALLASVKLALAWSQ